MLKCDRCAENYDGTTTAVGGITNTYLICPLCAYELRKTVDNFSNIRSPIKGRRACGHIVAMIYQDRNTHP